MQGFPGCFEAQGLLFLIALGKAVLGGTLNTTQPWEAGKHTRTGKQDVVPNQNVHKGGSLSNHTDCMHTRTG